jgi:glycerol kinase
MNTGDRPVESAEGLLTTIAWGVGGEVRYALEGSVFVSGAAIQWLRDEMDLMDEAADSEWMAAKVEDTCGVYFVPAFVGLGAPHWDPFARGVITGLTRATNKYHIVRAALESMAYQTCDLLDAMRKGAGVAPGVLKVDGGASANDFLMQFQADVLGMPVKRPACIETTALGAAYLAGLSAGFWESREEIEWEWKLDRGFVPGECRAGGADGSGGGGFDGSGGGDGCGGSGGGSSDGADGRRARLLEGWKKAVEASKGWAQPMK